MSGVQFLGRISSEQSIHVHAEIPIKSGKECIGSGLRDKKSVLLERQLDVV